MAALPGPADRGLDEEQLVRANLDLPAREAKRWSRVPTIEREELVAEGAIGLLQAARSYDPRRGPFRAYAAIRVRGAVTDAVRHHVRRRRLADESYVRLVSLEPTDNDGESTAIDPPDLNAAPIETVLEARDMLRAVRKLPARERIALIRNVVLGHTLAEIGADLGVSEARACQLSTLATARLRATA